MKRRGFALAAVLWIIAGAGALCLALKVEATTTFGAGANRIGLLRAGWRAEGCLARARRVIDETLAAAALVSARWDQLDTIVTGAQELQGCDVRLEAAGVRFDLQHTDERSLRNVLLAAELSPVRVDSLVDAFLDWTDRDNDPRPLGAEREWYDSEKRARPGNSRLVSLEELHDIRGFESLGSLDSLFTVGSTRILVSHAPLAVIAGLPGMTAEALSIANELRANGLPVTLPDILERLPPAVRRELGAHMMELQSGVTEHVLYWTVIVRSDDGKPAARTELHAELRLDGARSALTKWRRSP